MIYLIGGAPRVGKSIIANKVTEAMNATLVSTDDLCSEVTKVLSPEEKKRRFPLPGFSGTASENTLTPEERVELQCISASSLVPALDTVIASALSEHRDLVIEGVHLLPEYVSRLHTQYGAENVRVLFLGLSDVESIVEGIVQNTSPSNWMRNSDKEVIRQVAGFVAAFSVHIQKKAEAAGFPYQERTADFESDVRRFSEYLLTKAEPPFQVR
ncbi:hypothetical protein KBD13_01975 [Patescibacteria group bacterium]|nr:hypothetical protein [Patescibacteria group bacterium]MDQ5919480.1 adenylate kinase [Patescibacteria group bacterium]